MRRTLMVIAAACALSCPVLAMTAHLHLVMVLLLVIVPVCAAGDALIFRRQERLEREATAGTDVESREVSA